MGEKGDRKEVKFEPLADSELAKVSASSSSSEDEEDMEEVDMGLDEGTGTDGNSDHATIQVEVEVNSKVDNEALLGTSERSNQYDTFGDSEGGKPKKAKRVTENKMSILIISSVLGNILEWYDFGVFASFSTELSKAFFTGGELEEMLKVYGVFAAAFFARPIGGFLLGLIGDKVARTLSLQISVVSMGASALFISLLPTNSYGSYKIGPAATFLLVGARLVQGLSTGGEMVGSMLYMVENVPEKAKCLVSAVPLCSAIAGTGTGYLVSAIITALLTEEQRILWGWRLAFAIGVPAGAVGFMFRSCLTESHSFAEASKNFAKRHGNTHPFMYALKNCKMALVTILILCMVVCGYFSGTVWYNEAWLEEFYTHLIGEERRVAKLHGRIINTVLLYCGLAGGALAAAVFIDRRPNVPLHHYMIFSTTCLIFVTPLALMLMAEGRRCLACVVLGQVLTISFFTLTVAAIAYWLTKQFPPTLQYTSIALSYNFGQALFGGTVPYISTRISSESSNVIAPAYYLSALALMGAVALLLGRLDWVKKMHGHLHYVMDM